MLIEEMLDTFLPKSLLMGKYLGVMTINVTCLKNVFI